MQHVASDIGRYGLLVVFLNVLLAEGGLPLPAFPILMTAAALLTKTAIRSWKSLLQVSAAP